MRWISCAVIVAGCSGSPAPDLMWNEVPDAALETSQTVTTLATAADAGADTADEVWATVDNTNYGIPTPSPPGPAPTAPQTVPPPPVTDAAPSLPFGQCAPSCTNNDTCNYCPRRSGVWCCTAGTCSPFSSSQCP